MKKYLTKRKKKLYEMRSALHKKLWQDPEYRAKMVAKQKAIGLR